MFYINFNLVFNTNMRQIVRTNSSLIEVDVQKKQKTPLPYADDTPYFGWVNKLFVLLLKNLFTLILISIIEEYIHSGLYWNY